VRGIKGAQFIPPPNVLVESGKSRYFAPIIFNFQLSIFNFQLKRRGYSCENWINGFPGNAIENSDMQEARTESDRVLKSVIFGIMADNMELFKQYNDNPEFKKWLSDMVFTATYAAGGSKHG